MVFLNLAVGLLPLESAPIVLALPQLIQGSIQVQRQPFIANGILNVSVMSKFKVHSQGFQRISPDAGRMIGAIDATCVSPQGTQRITAKGCIRSLEVA